MAEEHAPGAPPDAEFVPLAIPVVRGNEWTYVKECLDTAWVSSVGSYVDRFEEEFAETVGAEHAVATVNGTAALHVALRAVGVEPGDEVLVPTLTFIAPANTVRYVDAHPVLVDAEPTHLQMNVEQAVAFLDEDCTVRDGELRNDRTGRRVAAILPVHLLGHPVDMGPLLDAAERYDLPMVEDATESLGATYEGTHVGTLGEVGCFSFNGNKLITTGGGGMLVTDDEELARYARYLTTQAKDDPLEYVHHEVGYNYRLTNVLAAVGVAQLEQLDAFLESKRTTAAYYREHLADLPGITVPPEAEWATSAHWINTILVDEDAAGLSSRDLMQVLEDARIQARPLWTPVHAQRPYHDAPTTGVEVATRLHAQGLQIPSSVDITPRHRERVRDAIADALDA